MIIFGEGWKLGVGDLVFEFYFLSFEFYYMVLIRMVVFLYYFIEMSGDDLF